jgi:membrane protease YdiL (CAAX protease family)
MAAGLLSIVMSIVVVVVHHPGYPEFRGRKMAQAVLGCGILSLAYLFTGSVIAPILAHAVLHTVAVRNGMELPPHEESIRLR